MSEYINVSDATKYLSAEIERYKNLAEEAENGLFKRGYRRCSIQLGEVKKFIESFPKTKTKETPHGMWLCLTSNPPKYQCSECGAIFSKHQEVHYENYCPHCGAEMRGR